MAVAENSKTAKSAPNTVVIKARKGLLGIDLKELWQYRELIYFNLARYQSTL